MFFVWCGKTAQGSVSQRHIYRRKHKKNKRTWYCRYLRKWVWVTIALCLTSEVVPRGQIKLTNKQTKTIMICGSLGALTPFDFKLQITWGANKDEKTKKQLVTK